MTTPPFSPGAIARAWRGLAALACATLGSPAHAFVAGASWPDGNVVMHLQLGSPAAALADGSTSWGPIAESALDEWNTQLTRSRFTVVRDSTAVKSGTNRLNNVFFDRTIYGSAFEERVLAVTQIRSTSGNGRMVETDVVFNANLAWDSYRGTLRSATDFRRVALHEFGHVLGLDHPDTARPAQSVPAIMNSRISNLENLREDDIAGVKSLYDRVDPALVPQIVAQPQGASLQTGDRFTLSVGVAGTGPFTYEWLFEAPGDTSPDTFDLAKGPSYTIGAVQPVDSGRYSVLVRRNGVLVQSNAAELVVRPIATTADTLLANLSTRGVVGTGSNVIIGGLIIGGTTPKTVLIRAAGPGLAEFGVSGALANPTLRLVRSSDQATVAENDDWESAGNVAAIRATETRLAAFPFAAGSRDAALLVTLPPGNYTAVVSGVNNTTGVALVEAYDADPDAPTARTRKLANIATRGRVDSGENGLIAGFVASGPGPRTFLIRAIGPTLAKAPFNLGGALLDPFLQLYRGETLLRENDDWDSPAAGQAALRAAGQRVGAFPMMEVRDSVLRTGLDSAMLVTLPPGTYTAKVSGFEGSTGIGLIEIYEVP